jgi:hypothetical protein
MAERRKKGGKQDLGNHTLLGFAKKGTPAMLGTAAVAEDTRTHHRCSCSGL